MIFPDWFVFSQGVNDKIKQNGKLDKQYKQIGNAVPVMLAYAVAEPIVAMSSEQTLLESISSVVSILSSLSCFDLSAEVLFSRKSALDFFTDIFIS